MCVCKRENIIDEVGNCAVQLWVHLFFQLQHREKGCSQLSETGQHSVLTDLNSFCVQSTPAEHP